VAYERGQQQRPELAVGAAQPPPTRLAADDDQGAPGGEGAPEPGQRADGTQAPSAGTAPAAGEPGRR
jgi:hypothetical protein